MRFKDYFPGAWRYMVITDDCATLEFFGKANLEAMLEEWELSQQSLQAAFRVYAKKQPGSSMHRFLQEETAKAKTAMPAIREAIAAAEEKPILVNHRPNDFFSEGEKIYAYAQDDDFPELRGYRYKKVTVQKIEGIYLSAMLNMRGGYIFDIHASIRNVTFLKIDELKTLKSDARYRAFWIANITTDPPLIETIDKVIMGTRIR